jgi:hypothetical protein
MTVNIPYMLSGFNCIAYAALNKRPIVSNELGRMWK